MILASASNFFVSFFFFNFFLLFYLLFYFLLSFYFLFSSFLSFYFSFLSSFLLPFFFPPSLVLFVFPLSPKHLHEWAGLLADTVWQSLGQCGPLQGQFVSFFPGQTGSQCPRWSKTQFSGLVSTREYFLLWWCQAKERWSSIVEEFHHLLLSDTISCATGKSNFRPIFFMPLFFSLFSQTLFLSVNNRKELEQEPTLAVLRWWPGCERQWRTSPEHPSICKQTLNRHCG